jgi:amidase
VALGLDIVAGPAPGDAYVTPVPRRSFVSAVDERLKPLRTGWSIESPDATATPEVAAAVERTADALREMGHEVQPSIPDIANMWEPFLTILKAHTATTLLLKPSLLVPHTRALYDAGRRLSAFTYLSAESEVYRTTRRIHAWFDEFDILVCPAHPTLPSRLGELSGSDKENWIKLRSLTSFLYWVNMAGLPGISLPLAWSSEGLPIGVQLVSRPLAERTLISLSARLEEMFPCPTDLGLAPGPGPAHHGGWTVRREATPTPQHWRREHSACLVWTVPRRSRRRSGHRQIAGAAAHSR